MTAEMEGMDNVDEKYVDYIAYAWACTLVISVK